MARTWVLTVVWDDDEGLEMGRSETCIAIHFDGASYLGILIVGGATWSSPGAF